MARKKQLQPIHPGEILLEEFMKRRALASIGSHETSRSHRDASARFVNGQHAITAHAALRLGKYFGVSSERWLGLQTDFDLRVTKRTVAPELNNETDE